MGGVPAPQTAAFPSASQPNPIANGLRGNGPMIVNYPTGPATPTPTQPAGPGAPPNTTPTGPLGDPYSYSSIGGAASLQDILSGKVGPGGYGVPGSLINSAYFNAGTQIPAGYSLDTYYNPNTGQMSASPIAGEGGLYSYAPGINPLAGQVPAGQLNAFNTAFTAANTNPALWGQMNSSVANQAGPAALPYIGAPNTPQNQFSNFYTGGTGTFT